MIEACYLTSFVRGWLARRPAVRVLHVFDRACNLVDDRGEIVSLVTADLGPGPFAVVLPATTPIFSQLVTAATPVTIDGDVVKLGALVVNTAPAVAWPARPAWEQLRRQVTVFDSHLAVFRRLRQSHRTADKGGDLAYSQHFSAGSKRLLSGLAGGNADACRQGAQQLAGVGAGLTPAGDDFLVGAIYGLWATRSNEVAQCWGHVIAETAAPRTTLLSAAWLRAAARGEASEAWHELVRACARWAVDSEQWTVNSKQYGSQEIVAAVERILEMGHTSGADALAGFTAVLETQRRGLPTGGAYHDGCHYRVD